MTRKKILLLGVGLLGVAAVVFLAAAGFAKAPVFARDHLEILRADGVKIPYIVELATTAEQQEYGLMYRQFLPRDGGMLFVFAPPSVVKFWMKNTFIPLDMLFVRADGTIAQILHAAPQDLTPVGPEEPMAGVIELNGGAAEAKGIKVGDRVVYGAFGVGR